MKNYIIEITVLSLLFTSNIIYPKAITNFRVDPQSFYNVETRKGKNTELLLNRNLADKKFLFAKINFIRKGLRFNVPVVSSPKSGNEDDAYVETINPNINYLSFPILIKYNLAATELVQYIIGGLRIDFVL